MNPPKLGMLRMVVDAVMAGDVDRVSGAPAWIGVCASAPVLELPACLLCAKLNEMT